MDQQVCLEVAAFLVRLPARAAERLLLCGLACGALRGTFLVGLFTAFVARDPAVPQASLRVETFLREEGLVGPAGSKELETMGAGDLVEVAEAILYVFQEYLLHCLQHDSQALPLWESPEEGRAQVFPTTDGPDEDADRLAYLLVRLPPSNAEAIHAQLSPEVRRRLLKANPARAPLFALDLGLLAEGLMELVRAQLLTLEQALAWLDGPLSLPEARWREIAWKLVADWEDDPGPPEFRPSTPVLN